MMRLMCVRVVCLSLALGLYGLSGTSLAQAPRELFLRGQTAYKQGDYDAAIRDWEAAYKQDARPLLKYNIAQAYERLGKLEQAVEALDVYLARAQASDPYQADARARRAALATRLQNTGVRIVGAPDGAKIVIDQKEWGVTPRPDPILLKPGAHRIELTHKGYRTLTSVVAVSAGQIIDVPVEMEALPAGSQESHRTEVRSRSVLPLVLIGIGGAGIIVGGLLGLRALSKSGDALPGTDTAASAQNLALAADISFGVGIAAATTGVIMWLIETPSSTQSGERQARNRWHLVPELRPHVAGVSGGFSF